MAGVGGGLVAVSPATSAFAGAANDQVTVGSSLNPSVFGDRVTFAANVAGAGTPTGSVTFTYTNGYNGPNIFTPTCAETGSNSVPLDAKGNASCTPTKAILGGADTVTASYGGDGTFIANSGSVSQNVNARPTTATITDNGPNPSSYGQAVSFTGTVVPQTTTVQQASIVPAPTNALRLFSNGFTPANVVNDCRDAFVSTTGSTTGATCQTKQLAPGKDSVGFYYEGDGNYLASPLSSTVPQTVGKSGTTTGLVDNGPNPSGVGQAVKFTATVTPNPSVGTAPTGTVTFSSGGSSLCTTPVSTSGGVTTATCTTKDLPLGTDYVTATYSGDVNYSGSTSKPVSQSVSLLSTLLGLVGGVLGVLTP
ncbi:MAG TPA: Ig-like domain-containing protein [Acidimicrobiales bacterium]|nr:Ig-like domain-containing protein [Acidimicrobiales bacterium]